MSAIISLTPENITDEHICCAMSDKKCQAGVQLKKGLVTRNYPNGHRFRKLNVNGKVFIEYMPVDHSLSAVEAPGYFYIQCLWVSGQYKSKGYGNSLLEECYKDTMDSNGLVILSSSKKKPFLAEQKFLIKHGFEVVDEAAPYFQLMVKKFKDAPLPKFSNQSKSLLIKDKGMVVYYTDQCPFMDYYVNQELAAIANNYNMEFKICKVNNRQDALHAPTPFPMYTIFIEGEFFTHEIMNKKRFEKLYNKVKN